MATGLVYVSSKPLDLHPNAPASIAMNKLMNERTRQLQMYDVIYNRLQTRPRGLALCLIDDFGNVKTQASQLHRLLPQTKDSIDAENKGEAYDEPPAEETPHTDSPELPPELQPVLQESGLPGSPEDESEIINDGYDIDFDALDLKNLPDYDPDMDPELSFYTNDVINAWIRADQEECANGAKIRLYETLDIPSDHPAGSYSEAHKEFPMTPSSPLAPNLLIYQIPSAKSDYDFACMYQSYAFMTMHYEYQRISCFRQDDPSIPRWLVVQEFRDLYDDLALKKKQGEYVWRKNGWEGVKVEFFRARERS